MSPTQDDERALRQALRNVSRLAKAAEQERDTEAVRKALWALRGAAIDAGTLALAIEDNTRSAALRGLVQA